MLIDTVSRVDGGFPNQSHNIPTIHFYPAPAAREASPKRDPPSPRGRRDEERGPPESSPQVRLALGLGEMDLRPDMKDVVAGRDVRHAPMGETLSSSAAGASCATGCIPARTAPPASFAYPFSTWAMHLSPKGKLAGRTGAWTL